MYPSRGHSLTRPPPFKMLWQCMPPLTLRTSPSVSCRPAATSQRQTSRRKSQRPTRPPPMRSPRVSPGIRAPRTERLHPWVPSSEVLPLCLCRSRPASTGMSWRSSRRRLVASSAWPTITAPAAPAAACLALTVVSQVLARTPRARACSLRSASSSVFPFRRRTSP